MIFIAGGTGYIGGHLLAALRERGLPVRCLIRTPEKAEVCRGPMGGPGFETAIGDITDRESLRGALEGAGMVVHLVGIIEEKGPQTFKRVHVEGTKNLIEEAKQAGVRHFFYQSALGADAGSWAGYLRTKGEAEELLKASGLPYTIFRPSLVIGPGDGFTQKIRDFINTLSPVLPVPGKGEAKFQPIYVGDWVKCFLKIIDNPSSLGRTYELGGPEHLAYNDMVKAIRDAMGSVKPVVHIPVFLVKAGASLLGVASVEQIKLLEKDNITTPDAVRRDFGFEPLAFREALKLFVAPYLTTRTGQGE